MAVNAKFNENTNTLTIEVVGEFTFSLYREFRDAYKPYDKAHQFDIDLSETRYMDSAALGMMLLLKEFAGGDDAKIRICNANEGVQKVLRVANFDKQFEIA